ncbi:MAG TPA: type II toxin-antitoxin system prevent-host-death family antitoxin [Methylophilaceae bacterium]|jgi:antitoxin (DNA-binding transcriptional repressor) of toxin-antitoxin stability system
MKTVNIHQAKTQLLKLIGQAVQGESFVIVRAGKPLVKVTKINAHNPKVKRRLGFMKGQIQVPSGFDEMGKEEIAKLFGVE